VLDLVAEHARGPLGAARVRSRRPRAEVEGIREELAAVGELLALAERGESIDIPPVPELEPVLRRLAVPGSVLNGPELLAIRQCVAAGRVARGELARIAPEAPRAAARSVPLPDKALERRLDAALAPDGELLDGASPRLARARRAVHEARERLVRKLEAVIQGLDPRAVPPGAQVTVRGGRYVIPVRRDSRSRPAGIVHDESASEATLFVEPTDAIETGNALRSATADADREALAVLRELTELCRPERAAIAALHELCVAGDDLMARVRYALAVRGAVPRIGSSRLVLQQARHPLLLHRGVPVVPFDLELAPEERTLLVSGPNAGGKTVLLKTVGVASLLAQAGVVPPLGPGSELPVFGRIFADIGDHQSLAADLSTFSGHVAALREILAEAGPDALVLIDEMGSGTDPAEGAALARAALAALTARGARSLATTHLGALKTLAGDLAGVVNGSLEFDAEALQPTFRFQKGVPGRSYGLAIAARLGVDSAVLRAAEAQVPARERALDELLSQVEHRARGLEERERSLSARLAEVEAREASSALTEAAQRERERELRRREREAERLGHREARKHLLDARGKVEEALRLAQSAAGVEATRAARRLVEEAARAESAALERLPADDLGPLEGPALRPGQRVRVGGGGVGAVLELRPDGRATVALGAVRVVVPAAELTPVSEAERRQPPRGDEPTAPEGEGEIDLRGLTGDEAHAATLAALDAAVLGERPTLRIIHGMGTGVVRDRVRRVLQADRRVARFEFAPRHLGGTGVTIAELGGGR
jgi:DNA mismatch repair protein MutS2